MLKQWWATWEPTTFTKEPNAISGVDIPANNALSLRRTPTNWPSGHGILTTLFHMGTKGMVDEATWKEGCRLLGKGKREPSSH